MKKRILFFMAGTWSFGRFFSDLTKYLFPYDFDCVLLDYSVLYNYHEFNDLAKNCDYVVTNPSGIKVLPGYGVPLSKSIMIMFHSVDVHDVRRWNLPINEVARCCAINQQVKDICTDFNVPIEIVEFGINTETFRAEPSTELRRVGFSGAYLTRQQTQTAIEQNNLEPKIYKRGFLAAEAASIAGLDFIPAVGYEYQTMPGYYSSVDAILSCSTDEGAGGSVLEGGAAGRLIITTNSGGWESFVTEKGAHGLPVDEKEYLLRAIDLLIYYKFNPQKYRDRCYEIQEYAKKKYDLELYLDSWIRVFSGY